MNFEDAWVGPLSNPGCWVVVNGSWMSSAEGWLIAGLLFGDEELLLLLVSEIRAVVNRAVRLGPRCGFGYLACKVAFLSIF